MTAFIRENERPRSSASAALVLLLFSVALLLIAGSDGWLRVATPLSDRAWFTLCGKSWMSGLTPYVDFTDSKGPLLWLLYGLGYLISPHSLHGMFLFEVPAYWATFYILYRCALLFIESAPKAMSASMLCAFLFFAPGMHEEMLIEDYGHLCNAVALYVMAATFRDGRLRMRHAFALGVAAGAMLMMKYLYFLTLLVPAAALLLSLLVRRRLREAGVGTLVFIAGVAAVSLPFVVYLYSAGAFGAFVNEYFLNTYGTVAELSPEAASGAGGIAGIFLSRHIASMFMWVIFAGLLVSLYVFRRNRWLCGALAAWYAVSVIPCAMMGVERMNYFLNLCVFAFGGTLFVASLPRRVTLPGAVLSGALILFTVTLYTTYCRYSEFYDVERARAYNAEMERVADVINKYGERLGRAPRYSYYLYSDKGEHLLTDAVAGTRYWSVQAGMTPEMLRRHKEEIFRKRPDIVIARADDTEAAVLLESAGYRPAITYCPSDSLTLYLLP